jgi:hypothetical protein
MDLKGISKITSKILGMTFSITKLELELCKFGGLWKFGVGRPSSGLITYS